MQVETMKDALHWATGFHHDLAESLELSSIENEDKRARMLLSYLAEHEEKVAEMVDEFERTGNPHALNTWCYEYVTRHPIVRHGQGDTPFATLNSREIMEVMIDQHAQLIELFRDLAAREDIQAAHDLAESLKLLEEHEMMRIAQTANRFEDL